MAEKKRKTVRKTKTARKGKPANRRTAAKSDRCQPLRDQLEEVDREIAEMREALAEPDIPEDLKEGLRRRLTQLTALRTRLLRALEACEEIQDDPRR
jgi:hypothetical protein